MNSMILGKIVFSIIGEFDRTFSSRRVFISFIKKSFEIIFCLKENSYIGEIGFRYEIGSDEREVPFEENFSYELINTYLRDVLYE